MSVNAALWCLDVDVIISSIFVQKVMMWFNPTSDLSANPIQTIAANSFPEAAFALPGSFK
jgi:hypothetical protein